MTDVVSSEKRSLMMSGIRWKDTKPEIIVRKHLHQRGFRFRLHVKALPGKPDIVFSKYRAVVFVHGCFWHKHDCHLFKLPSTRQDFWEAKLNKNKINDAKVIKLLNAAGWRVFAIWECALKGRTRIKLDEVIERTADWIVNGTSNVDLRGE
jgi:DNA mismatch endonuclease (patch repair protein)